jgi:large subunit ribosomal protein L10
VSRQKKAETVEKLGDILSRSTMAVITDYRGLTAAEMTELRRKLGEQGVEYRVVKNTLARFAAERAGRAELKALLQGPTALALGYGDIIIPARAVADFTRTSKSSLRIKGGLLEHRLLTSQEVATLSTLPPREVLIAKLMAGMQAPISALVGVLAANMRGLAGVLQARIQQLEGG